MGCGISRDASIEKSTVPPKILSPRKGAIQKLEVSEDEEDIINSFNFITDEIDCIQCPSGMVPIACTDPAAICVCTSNLILDDNNITNVKLPVIAASIANLGRIICLGHVSMLFSYYFLSKDTSAFYRNIFVWLTSKQILLSTVLLLNVAMSYGGEIMKELRSLGFTCENGDFQKDLSQYQLIIITTDVDFTKDEMAKLKEFSNNGGAILCCYAPSDTDTMSFSINEFLSEYGLSFMSLSLSSESSGPTKVRMPFSYTDVKNKVFIRMLAPLQELLSKDPINVEKLDDFVTEIRYIIPVTSSRHVPTIVSMIDCCWQYLNRTGYQDSEGKMEPDVVQSIVIILIIDLNSVLPISQQKVMPDCSTFPGIGKAELKDHKIELTLQDQTMTSTGLWLPAGVVGTITIEDELKNPNESIVAQIGIHSESLVSQSATWKRWPQVVTAYKLKKGTTQVYSQFGGIVYIASNDLEAKRKVTFVFRNFAKHARAVEGKPEKYEQTKNIDVPWAEIQSQKCIFTLPTTEFNEIEDITKIYKFMNKIVKCVAEFCSYPVKRTFRVAFDIQTPSGKPVASYPIFLDYHDMNDILFEHKRPTVALYHLLTTLATVCFTEDYFDSLTEQSLAQIVAAQVIMNLYGVDIEDDETYEKTKLFRTLWSIHNEIDNAIIPQIIENSIQSSNTVFYDEEDRWANFTTEISKVANLNFAPAFEKLRRIPKNISADVEQFPVFKL